MIQCTDCSAELGIDDVDACWNCGAAMCFDCATEFNSTCSDCQSEMIDDPN